MTNWILQNGQIIAFFAQLIYWLGILVAVFYALVQYKRWVNFQMGVGKSGQLRDAKKVETVDTKEAPNVDDFVD